MNGGRLRILWGAEIIKVQFLADCLGTFGSFESLGLLSFLKRKVRNNVFHYIGNNISSWEAMSPKMPYYLQGASARCMSSSSVSNSIVDSWSCGFASKGASVCISSVPV